MEIKLGDYVKIKTGKLNANAQDANGEFPFFTCAKEISKISTYAYDCECVLVAGNGILNAKYYKGKFNAYQRVYIIEVKDKEIISTRFLFYFIDKYMEKLRDGSIGGIIKYIKLNHLTDITLNLPDLPTQNKIVALLDKAKVLVRKRERSISLSDELLRAQFLEMFGSLASKTQKYPLRKLQEFEVFITSGGRGWKKYYSDNGGRFIRSSDVQMNNISNEDIILVNPPDNQEAKRTKVKPNDILLTITGSKIGRVTIVPPDFGHAYVSQHVAIIRVKDINQLYLSYFLSNGSNGQYLVLSKQYGQIKPGLNFKQIRDFDVTFPPLKLQNQFESIFRIIQAQKDTLIQSKTELENLYNGLLQRAFNGQLNFNIDLELDALLSTINVDKEDNDIRDIATVYASRLLERLDSQDFENQTQYQQAKEVAFQMLKEGTIEQAYDTKEQAVKMKFV